MLEDDLIRPWLDCLRPELPGLELIDAHTHIGHADPDGVRMSAEGLTAALARAGARGVVFPMQEPGGYPAANERVREAAAASAGRLVPFCRVDPAAAPLAEARRSLDAGARGIKLHPRAERFTLAHPAVARLVALAEERCVPVLVHAGRGIPALGRDALRLCAAHPGATVILAHAGVSDLGWIWREAAAHPNLCLDTSWWSPLEQLALLTLVPPGQILFASDAPYGTPATAAAIALRAARHAGLGADDVRDVAGGNLARVLAGAPAPAPRPPAEGERRPVPLLAERVWGMLATALGKMLVGGDSEDFLGLARLACDVPDDDPAAPVCRSVRDLLRRHAELVVSGAPRNGPFPAGINLVALAAAVARTPDAPLPDLPG